MPATPKGYTDKTEIENYLLQDIDSSFDDQLDNWIAGVEKIIDNITGENFIADTTATERLFDGDGTQELLIDSCVAVTLVEVGEDDYGATFTAIPSTGADRYFLDPPNAQSLDRKVPYYKVTLRSRRWPEGKQNNRITAKWGYSVNVPDDIKFVATVFVAGILNQHRQGGDQVKTEKIGNYSVTYNTDLQGDSWSDFEQAKKILQSYTTINL